MVELYDSSVANMTTAGGKQLTVIWHVNDLMSLCKEDFELTVLVLPSKDIWTKTKYAYWKET
jgi:hypothetical protein